ncbi:hypothetical protein HON71_04890 [Candidatus Woesearchaeota archaeon]|jgi:hypothetical protein|nr:hypothetical protein [Candidatus Woesearchaeota archaeon]MBT5342370.1 hypothetical protein [Candidatus Woesearchaeota archaeon]MBT6774349.1 hypothetical protein [Candidatus Woesearchaeota archaeon]
MRKRRSFKGWELQDFQKYCNDNYAGMSRSEVADIDPGFYKKVLKEGFTDEVLLKSKQRSFKGWELQDFKDLYENNYAGMSRNEIADIDPGFYGKIGKEGFINEVLPESIKKPNGYWKNISNVQSGLEPIIEELGRFPTTDEINKRNSGLMNAIKRHHGNLTKVRVKLGYEKTNYEDINNVQNGLEPIIEELGRFPTRSEIRKRNKRLFSGISNYQGGLIKVKIQLGYADKEMEVLKEILEELRDE